MAVLATALCTRSGVPIFARQSLLCLSEQRLTNLLSLFPQLIKSDQQHTYVENEVARFIYYPLGLFYLVIITNKVSNLIQDIDTLNLLVKSLTQTCDGKIEERDILESMFDIIVAFDEIVSVGIRENVNISSLQTLLSMESHEEMVQEIIARNKMQEAREAAKLKMKQIELQKKEASRRGSDSGSFYPASIAEEVARQTVVHETINANPSTSQPRIGKGMKLGSRGNFSS